MDIQTLDEAITAVAAVCDYLELEGQTFCDPARSTAISLLNRLYELEVPAPEQEEGQDDE